MWRRDRPGPMGVQQPALIPLVLLGMWVTSCHCMEGKSPAAVWSMRLADSSYRCLGQLEVNYTGNWMRVCRHSWIQNNKEMICKHLGCGSPSNMDLKPYFPDARQKPMRGVELDKMSCRLDSTTDLKSCSWNKSNCTDYMTIVCKEPEKTSTIPPTTTTPEPTGPPQLRLVDGKFSCSGNVELYMGGRWGMVQSSPENENKLANWVCWKLGCGDALEMKDQKKPPFFIKDKKQHLPVRWKMVAPCDDDFIPACFSRTRNSQDKVPASVICSGSQPSLMRRLGDSHSPCEGVLEVFHNGNWEVLCDSNLRKFRGEQMCQELQCGNLSSAQRLEDTKTMGVSCNEEHLQLCSTFTRLSCLKTRIQCQKFKPPSAGVGAGTIVSILLALILLGIFIVICGPPAYKKLQKKYSKKKQRQWIGPTGLQQNVSFHRNSAVTLRPRQEGQAAHGEDNDYSQTPKKNSYLSTYPALEGALRSSNPPDNSSDSDYDLHTARRL